MSDTPSEKCGILVKAFLILRSYRVFESGTRIREGNTVSYLPTISVINKNYVTYQDVSINAIRKRLPFFNEFIS